MDGKGTFWVKTTTAKWLLDIFQVKKKRMDSMFPYAC